MHTCTTQRLIDQLVSANCGSHADARTRYLLCQALHGLVRLAKAEHMQEISRSVDLALGQSGSRPESGTDEGTASGCMACRGQDGGKQA